MIHKDYVDYGKVWDKADTKDRLYFLQEASLPTNDSMLVCTFSELFNYNLKLRTVIRKKGAEVLTKRLLEEIRENMPAAHCSSCDGYNCHDQHVGEDEEYAQAVLGAVMKVLNEEADLP